MTDEEFDNAIPRNYYIRVNGYNNKVLRERRHTRKYAYIHLMGQVDLKKLPFETFCKEIDPLPDDEFKEPESIFISPEKFMQLQKIHSRPIKKKK